MPELPELVVMARQMKHAITGKIVADITSLQPKSLNMRPDEMCMALSGRRVGEITNKGKWLILPMEPEQTLLINLGMGADLVYHDTPEHVPPKYQFRMDFTDDTGFTIRFWWFGHVHLVPTDQLASHKMTCDLGPSPLDPEFTPEAFHELLRSARGKVKSFLLDQRRIAGVGNAYAHDILFKAKIHPDRAIPSLTPEESDALYASVRDVLNASIVGGGAYYEKDFYGRPGGYAAENWIVGYREGTPCPVCGTIINKIKTGSTSSYVCPACQPRYVG